MRKILLPLILMAFFLPSIVMGQNIHLSPDDYTITLPEGRVNFPFNDKKIIVKFQDGYSEEAILQYFASAGLFETYNKEWKVPHPVLYRPVFKEGISYNEAIAAMEQHSFIDYVAPVVQYKDMEQSLYSQFYVQVKNSDGLVLLRDLATQFNFEVVLEYTKDVYRCRINKTSAGNAFELVRYLQDLDRFVFAEPDFIYTCKLNTNDPYYTNQWGINNTGQYSGTPGADMDVVNAWSQITGNPNIKVAILDCFGSVAEFTHPDITFFDTHDQTGGGFVSTGFNGDAHGINCAGIVAATGNNNTGTVGVAYGANVIAVKLGTIINGSGSWSSTLTIMSDAITWSWQNADIVSNSNSFGSSSALINNAIDNGLVSGRNGAGTLFFSSTGNSNTTTIGNPASYASTIAVSASTNCDERKSPTSCGGESWWGCDYGVGNDVAAPGVKWHSTDLPGANGYSSGDYYQNFNGTSSSCPAAAAVMALVYSMNPTLSAANARYILETTTEKVGGYIYTSGVSGQPNGTWSSELGYGRINANQAVLAANCAGGTNDDCANATVLPLNSTCSYTAGTLCRATQSLAPTNCSGSTAPRAADVWYSVTPSGTSGTGVTITCASGAAMNAVMGIYSGTCTGLSLMQCVNATGIGGTETMTVTGLTSGTTYFVRVYDADGSTYNADFQICAVQCGPTTPTVSPAGPVALCAGNSQTLTITNACSGCSFAWSGGGTGTTKSVNAAGNYTVTATNSCGTSVNSNSVAVTIDPLPVVPTVTPAGPVDICGTGSQLLTISNPCTSCTFDWSNTGTGTTQTINTAGNYTATATNGCGTSATSNSVTISITPDPVVPIVTPAGPLDICSGMSQTLTVTNPCTGCTFDWSNTDVGTTSSVSTAGNYTATATNGCGTSAPSNSVTVTILPLPVVPIVIPAGPLAICSSNPATLTVSNPCTGCTFDWSNTATGTSTAINITGSYTATSTNSCGTSAPSNAVTINVTPQPSNPTGASAAPTSICSGFSSTLTVSGTLSTGANWVWTTGSCSGTVVGTGPSISVSPTANTTYYVHAENGICASTCAMVTVTVNPTPTANAGANQTVCSGTPVQIGAPFVSGNSYSWLPATGLNNPNFAQPTATPLTTTTYTLTRTNGFGCQDTAQVTITVNPLPVANAGPNQLMCSGYPTTIGTPLVPGYNYSWAPATSLNSTTVALPVTTTTVPITYTVTVTNPGTNCISSDAMSITINPVPTADAGPTVMVAPGFGSAIGGSPTGTGLGPLTYSWLPVLDLNDPTLPNPFSTPTATTTYTVTVFDGNNCPGTDTVTIIVLPPCVDPIAGFYATQTSGNCPLSVDFVDTSHTSGPATYQWTIYVDGGAPVISASPAPTAIIYNTEGSFSVELIITDSCGSDTMLMTNYINVLCPVSTASAELNKRIDIFPNPATDIVNINATGITNGEYSLVVQNMLGQTIHSRKVTVSSGVIKEKISLAPYANGVYTIQLRGSDVSISRKIEKR